MSDDRFKQARRSLIDRNKQRQQEEQDGAAPGEMGDDEFHEEAATQMIDVNNLRGAPSDAPSGGGQPQQQQQPGGGPSSTPDDDFAEAATQMVDINNLQGAPPQQPAPSQPPSSPGPSAPSQSPSGGNQQVFTPGGGGGHEGKTDFINIADFADQQAEFAPEDDFSGYEGKTDFIHIDALTGGPGGPGGAPQSNQPTIASDPVLNQSYQFGPESIQQGEVTLIFAQNALGKPVVLRQVWAGDPGQVPPQVRQRLAQFDDLDHPRLVNLNGVFASQTGLWADLQRPEGYRLTAVLEQHGGQDKENVINWLEQTADVLDTVHQAQLVYANLTPDAIWIQEDNSVVIEPFDLLSFEARGNLGPFGPPELDQPAENQQLSPATDVFSLAAVGAAALTGLPYHREKLSNYEDSKLAKKLEAAMAANPQERPQSVTELVDSIGSGGGFSLDPAELDIKVVAVIAVLLLGGFAGYMYWQQEQAKKQAAQEAAAQQQAVQQQGAQQQAAGGQQGAGQQGAGAGQEQAAAQEPAGDGQQQPATASTTPPGQIESDPRLQIVSSYQKNPPAEAAAEQTKGEKEDEAEAGELRDAARKHLATAEELAERQDKLDEYTRAMESLTQAIRLSGGQPTEADKKLLDRLRDTELVETYRKEVRKRVHDAMENGEVGEARFPYKRLSAIDYRAGASDFFDRNATPEVRVVYKAEKPEDDEEK